MCCSKVLVIAVCLLALGVSAASSAVLMIDDFENGDTNLTVEGTAPPNSKMNMQYGLSGVVKGKRYSYVQLDSGPDSLTTRVNYFDSGVFALSSGYNTRGQAQLGYGDDDYLNWDITDGGTNSLLIVEFLTADLAGILDVRLTTGYGGGSSTWTGPTPGGLFNTPTEMMIPLSGAGWTDHSVDGPADRTDIDLIRITLHGVENGDYAIEQIYINTPEPASLALLSIGALAILKRRRVIHQG